MDDLIGEFLALVVEEQDRTLIILRRVEMLLVRRNRLIVRADKLLRKMPDDVGMNVGKGVSPRPIPKPDWQVSKHPAFQPILNFFLFRTMLLLMTVQTERLHIVSGVGLFETRKLLHRDNMIQLRCFRENQTSAFAALVFIAFEGL